MSESQPETCPDACPWCGSIGPNHNEACPARQVIAGLAKTESSPETCRWCGHIRPDHAETCVVKLVHNIAQSLPSSPA